MNERELLFSFKKEDFEITWFNGTGPGGQNRNKRKNCCRIKHIESGLMASCQEHKSASQNKRAAFYKLVSLLINHYVPAQEVGRGMSNETTRTYNESKNYVKDHVTGRKFSYHETVGKGDISEIVEDRLKKRSE